MKIVNTKRPTIRGVDVSKWQKQITWGHVANAGIEFAIVRAAYGKHKDVCFDKNWYELSKTKIVQGCYQFFLESYSGTEQADALCDIIEGAGGLLPDELPPVLDVEELPTGESPYPTSQERFVSIRQWIVRIMERLNRVPIIYTTPYYWQNSVTKERLGVPLWISHVREGSLSGPMVPDSWSTWLLWQWSWEGKVAGISGDVDLNYFEGTVNELKYLCRALTPDNYRTLRGLRNGDEDTLH